MRIGRARPARPGNSGSTLIPGRHRQQSRQCVPPVDSTMRFSRLASPLLTIPGIMIARSPASAIWGVDRTDHHLWSYAAPKLGPARFGVSQLSTPLELSHIVPGVPEGNSTTPLALFLACSFSPASPVGATPRHDNSAPLEGRTDGFAINASGSHRGSTCRRPAPRFL